MLSRWKFRYLEEVARDSLRDSLVEKGIAVVDEVDVVDAVVDDMLA